MTQYTVILSHPTEEPQENYGCKCASCRERWGRRVQFQHYLVVMICTERRDIANRDVWQASIDICNAIDAAQMTYVGLKWGDLNIITQEQLAENPELQYGSPAGVTLQ